MPTNLPTIGLRLPLPLHDKLRARADALGVSVNSYILLTLASELGFAERDNDATVTALLERHGRESKRAK
jgi:hypothetical protein